MKTPFRGLGAILYKEFLVVWRDPMTLFFMFFPPLLQIIAFGFALDKVIFPLVESCPNVSFTEGHSESYWHYYMRNVVLSFLSWER